LNIIISIKDKSGNLYREVTLDTAAKPLSIGRAAACGLVIDSPSVSNEHAEIKATEYGIEVRNLNSINGVVVNHRKLLRKTILKPGSTFVIGDYSFLIEPLSPEDQKRVDGNKKNKMLMMVLLLLVVVTLLAFVMKKKKQEALAAQAAAASAISNAPIVMVGSTNDELAQAVALFAKAEQVLYNEDNYLKAAQLLTQVLTLNPHDARAKSYLSLIRYRMVDPLLAAGQDNLENENLQAATAILQKLQSADSNYDKVQEFARQVKNLARFIEAKGLYQKGQYDQTREILESITLLNDDERHHWLDLVQQRLTVREKLGEADTQINSQEYTKALGLLNELHAQGSLTPAELARVQTLTQTINSILAFEGDLTRDDPARTITHGTLLLANADVMAQTQAWMAISRQMDELKAKLTPQKASYQRTADQYLQKAGETNAVDPYPAVQAQRYVLDSLTVLTFIDPDGQWSGQMEQMRKGISQYVRQTFKKAYVGYNQLQYDYAAQLFSNVIAVADENDGYAQQARALLDKSTYGPAYQTSLAQELNTRMQQGEDVLPGPNGPTTTGTGGGSGGPVVQPTDAASASAPASGQPANPAGSPSASQQASSSPSEDSGEEGEGGAGLIEIQPIADVPPVMR
jgi:tetratricopeptide (TPR) repeat protein